jgi:hypothetical protein
MLNYGETRERQLNKIYYNNNKLVKGLSSAINQTAFGLAKKEKENKIEKDKKLTVLAGDLQHNYKMDLDNVLYAEYDNPNDKIQAILDTGQKYLGELAKIKEPNRAVHEAYKSIAYDTQHKYNKVREYEQKLIKEEQKKDFVDKLTFGTFKSVAEAMEQNKALNLGIKEKDIIKSFENLGNQRAIQYIQNSMIDGVPSELLRFKTRDDVVKAFFPELGNNAKIQQGVISAIATAHNWQIRQIEKKSKERERRAKEARKQQQLGVNSILRRLQYEIARANNNGVMIPPSIENSLKMISGIGDEKIKDKASYLFRDIADNKNILGAIQQGVEAGMSQTEIENKLASYTTISKNSKSALINKAFDRYLGRLEEGIDESLRKGDINTAGQYFSKMYSIDLDKGHNISKRIIKKELSTLSASTIDSLMGALTLHINAEENAGNPTPLLEKSLLNELDSAKQMVERGESKKDIADYLAVKKREYLERKRTKNLRGLKKREGAIREGLKNEWLEFDNEATSKDIRNFLVANPDIPDNRVYEAFKKQAVDIDTTDIPFYQLDKKFKLADSIRNGKLLIPDDREFGDDSISPFLKQFIPEHSDAFTKFVISSVKKNLDNKLGEVDNFYFVFNKTPHGLQLQAYGTPKGDVNEELIGVINASELKDFVNTYNTKRIKVEDVNVGMYDSFSPF